MATRNQQILQTGVCRVCGCTDDHPCEDPDSGAPCFWVDTAHTICSGEKCFASIPLAELEGTQLSPGFLLMRQ